MSLKTHCEIVKRKHDQTQLELTLRDGSNGHYSSALNITTDPQRRTQRLEPTTSNENN